MKMCMISGSSLVSFVFHPKKLTNKNRLSPHKVQPLGELTEKWPLFLLCSHCPWIWKMTQFSFWPSWAPTENKSSFCSRQNGKAQTQTPLCFFFNGSFPQVWNDRLTFNTQSDRENTIDQWVRMSAPNINHVECGKQGRARNTLRSHYN